MEKDMGKNTESMQTEKKNAAVAATKPKSVPRKNTRIS